MPQAILIVFLCLAHGSVSWADAGPSSDASRPTPASSSTAI